MVETDFICDIIVVRIDAPTQNFADHQQLRVDIRFRRENLQITSSRINVVEFKPGRSYEFRADPKQVREDFEYDGLKVTLKYAGETIGIGQVIWPESVLEKINSSMTEFTQVDTCDIYMENSMDRIGTIEVIVRLQTKCEEVDTYGGARASCIDKTINPQDILFIVGETQTCPDPCAGLYSSESDKQGQLDLSRYRSINGRLVQSPDIVNTNDCGSYACCELKKMSAQYQELLDSIGAKCPKPQQQQQPCVASSHFSDYQKMSKRGTSSSGSQPSMDGMNGPCCCFAARHSDIDTFAGGKLVQLCGNPPPHPDPLEQTIQTRYCPICKANMSWLPKLATCPKCGYKPVPVVPEKKTPRLTADQILAEYLGTSNDASKMDQAAAKAEEEQKKCQDKECRCTCKLGKICAHCRIRKLCEDIFQIPADKKDEPECPKIEVKSSDGFNVVNTSSKDCRPYLARVFSELRDLYDIKEAKTKTFDYDAKCEKEMRQGESKRKPKPGDDTAKQESAPTSPKKKKKKSKGKEEFDRSVFLKKNFKQAKLECSTKNYYKKTDRKYPGNLIGHKNCTNGFTTGRRNVPRNMGWLWSINSEAKKYGWRPGAIRKPIKGMMRYFLKDKIQEVDSLAKCKEVTVEETPQHPTLHVCKKNHEIFITLRPIKTAEALKGCANSNMNQKPIRFKIVKNPLMLEMRNLKRCLKEKGFNTCSCHKPIVQCICRNFMDKKRLEYQLNEECTRRQIANCEDTLILSDTTDSDVEFDFGVTPPAGVAKPPERKPQMVSHGTQYTEGDWNVKPLYPKDTDPFKKCYNCAIGDRYGTKFATGFKKSGGYGDDDEDGKGKKKKGKGGPIPVRGLKRLQAGGPIQEEKKEDKSVNMMKYLQQMGGLGGGGGGVGKDAMKGPDGLTDAQRKRAEERKKMAEVLPPPLCVIDRRGKPIDPCAPHRTCDPCDPCCRPFDRIC